MPLKPIFNIIAILTLLTFHGCHKEADELATPLSITSFSPGQGTPGTTITIIGTGFSADVSGDAVKFNGIVATVATASITQLTVVVPVSATSGKISVAVNDRTVSSATDFVVLDGSSIDVPSITAVDPSSGSDGDVVTITGVHFESTPANNVVKFNGATATVATASPTQLTVVVPEYATSGKITVTVRGLTATSANNFTIVVSPLPALTTSTAKFVAKNSVTFGGNVSSFGGNPIVVWGACYGTEANPTISTGTNVLALEEPGLESAPPQGGAIFTVNISALSPNQTYHVRVFAANDIGTSYGADMAFNTLGVYTVSTIAGTGQQGTTNGTALGQASFSAPVATTLDAQGNIYVMDQFNGVRKISGGQVSTLVDNFQFGYDLACDGTNLYASHGQTVARITPDGTLTTVAGSGAIGNQDSPAGQPGTTATFSTPYGLVLDANNSHLYVADPGNQTLRKIDIANSFAVTTLPSTPGTIDPYYISVDANGIYFTNGDGIVRTLSVAGTFGVLAGRSSRGNADGQGTSASFRGPMGVAFDGKGNLFVADTDNNLIRRIDPFGNVATIAGTLTPGSADGVGADAGFSAPTGLHFDAATNSLYVSDRGNFMIRKILIE